MAPSLSQDQLEFFHKYGYIILRNLLTPSETEDLKKWAQEVYDWKPEPDSIFMPYEEVTAHGQRILCRTENFADCHSGFNGMLRSEKLMHILEQLADEPMLLFKEKINYKLPGSGGWAPHTDATAYKHIKNIHHITILLAVDKSNMTNGGLEVVDGSHNVDIPINEDDYCIQSAWVEKHEWTPVELEPGELLAFGSYLAHRSRGNKSGGNRKAIYATYNRVREGDLRKSYYDDRKELFPATHMRQKGKDYAEGSMTYGFGGPLLSVETGRQLEV